MSQVGQGLDDWEFCDCALYSQEELGHALNLIQSDGAGSQQRIRVLLSLVGNSNIAQSPFSPSDGLNWWGRCSSCVPMESQEQGPDVVRVDTSVSNQEFFERYARSGCVGLVGGTTLIDKAIVAAQRRLDGGRQWSRWSHAFLITEQRADGHWWVIESDLEIHQKHVRLGAQENRAQKYWDPGFHTTLAILDFHLGPDQVRAVVGGGLDLVASRAKYSLREILGTLIALRHPQLRGRENLMARDHSFYCSAFVQHLYRKAGLDLAPGIPDKQTTPEDLSRSALPHTTYLLEREVAKSRVAEIARRVKARVRLRMPRRTKKD